MSAVVQKSAGFTDASTSILKRQLVKEIGCLERQMERVRQRPEYADDAVLQTFEAMVGNRRRMLQNLPFED